MQVRIRAFLAACLIGLTAVAALSLTAQADEKRSLKGVALVIGQSAYEHIAPLPNPANDAREIVKLLTDLGFDARSVSDRDARKLKRDLERFAEDAEGADVAFLYYSGHGIEADGNNWLVPVDADVSSLANASEALVSVSSVMEELKATVPVSIMLLDACRTNPFPSDAKIRMTPSGSAEPLGAGGLLPVRGAKSLAASKQGSDSLGMVIGFAAEPGEPALDGPANGNSPYASALLRHLAAMDGAEFGSVMRMVTEEVYLDTKARQRPWVNESLRRLLYFGSSPQTPQGDEATITSERRTLLLTISDLPDSNRRQVETVALKDDVPLGALYGVLKALGTEKIPEDPNELNQILDAQAERLKGMIAEREALKTDDPQIAMLTASADHALREGAIVSARKFLDQAVARVESTSDAVDDIEDMVRKKRIADAAIYAQRGNASALAFDYLAAAQDYEKAFKLVEKWDEKLRWNYKNMEAEAFASHGSATGDQDALRRAIASHKSLLDTFPRDDRGKDYAITRNNMAVVYLTIGERASDTGDLTRAADIFRDSLDIFAKEKDELNWAAAQNNLGNSLLRLGQRTGETATLRQAADAFRAAIARRPRETQGQDWASSQNNLGIALSSIAEKSTSADDLRLSEAAYRQALEVYTRAATPVEWAMVENNLGNTLNTLGTNLNDPAKLTEAIEAFRASLEVRTRDHFPLSWATTRHNLAGALANAGKFDLDTSSLEEAAQASRDALEVYTKDRFPLDWASAQNTLGTVLRMLGQRNTDVATLEASAQAFREAGTVWTKETYPLDWAMTRQNLGSSLQLIGLNADDRNRLQEAVSAYLDAADAYKKGDSMRQWALAKSALADVYHSMGLREAGTESFKASIRTRQEALTVLTTDNAPIDWASAQNGLGMSLIMLSSHEKSGAYLDDAAKAFEASLRVYTRAEQPLQWSFGQNNIGDVFWNKASFGKGDTDDLRRAVDYFEKAKQGFVEAGYAPSVALMDQKIAIVKKSLGGP